MHTVLFCFVLLWLHVLSTFVLYIRCVSSWELVQSYENPGVSGVTLKVTRKLDHCQPQHFDKAQNVDIIFGCVIWHYAMTYSNSKDPISDFILIRKNILKWHHMGFITQLLILVSSSTLWFLNTNRLDHFDISLLEVYNSTAHYHSFSRKYSFVQFAPGECFDSSDICS